MPLPAGICEPVWNSVVGQFPFAAPLMAPCRYGVLTLPPSRFTQADVFVQGGARQPAPSSSLPLDVMKLIGAPHPSDVLPWNGQLPTPIGKSHPSGGGLAGGFDVAIDIADTAIVLMPHSLNRLVLIVVLYRHITALTMVPSSEGSKRRPAPTPSGLSGSQTPSTMSP